MPRLLFSERITQSKIILHFEEGEWRIVWGLKELRNKDTINLRPILTKIERKIKTVKYYAVLLFYCSIYSITLQ